MGLQPLDAGFQFQRLKSDLSGESAGILATRPVVQVTRPWPFCLQKHETSKVFIRKKRVRYMWIDTERPESCTLRGRFSRIWGISSVFPLANHLCFAWFPTPYWFISGSAHECISALLAKLNSSKEAYG